MERTGRRAAAALVNSVRRVSPAVGLSFMVRTSAPRWPQQRRIIGAALPVPYFFRAALH
jgi:hypothetical protein